QVEGILEFSNRFKHTFGLRIKFDINIDGLFPKTQEQGGGASREVHLTMTFSRCGQLSHELMEGRYGDFSPHDIPAGAIASEPPFSRISCSGASRVAIILSGRNTTML